MTSFQWHYNLLLSQNMFLHNLSGITKYGKNTFLVIANLLYTIWKHQLNFDPIDIFWNMSGKILLRLTNKKFSNYMSTTKHELLFRNLTTKFQNCSHLPVRQCRMRYDKDFIARSFQKWPWHSITTYDQKWLLFSDIVIIQLHFFRLFSLQLISCFFVCFFFTVLVDKTLLNGSHEMA